MTGPNKRAVDSHVQTTGLRARSVRRAKANRISPVSDRAGSMKNLEEYLLKKPRKNKPVKISESPILSPDTLDALQNAEKLLKKAEKTILEASYDIASSPEREQSGRSVGEEEEDACYIRDVVATRFHEANESARIFTRPSARPLAERICRPVIRQRRSKRTRARIAKISNEKSATTALKSVQATNTKLENNRRIQSNQPRREQPSIRQETIFDFPSPWIIDNQNVTNLLRVQRGPQVDIPSELTITNVEKVDISPKPRSSFPVQQNIKTYKFSHESCVVDKENASEKIRTTEPLIDNTVTMACDSPTAPEKSRDPFRKSLGSVAASQTQGSGSDLVQNKLARSIPPKQIEGQAGNIGMSIANQTECKPEQDEKSGDNKQGKRNEGNNGYVDKGFIDFLRHSKNFHTADENNIIKDFPSLETNDEINIFDRAIDQLVSELRHEKRHQIEKNLPSFSKTSQNHCLAEKEVDGHLVDDTAKKIDDFMLREFQDTEYFVEEWLPEEINLEAPNLVHLQKTLNNFDRTMYKVLRGTEKLEVIMSEYSNDPEIAPGLINQHLSYNPRIFSSVATKDSDNELELKSAEQLKEKEKASDDYEDRTGKDTIQSCQELIGSYENSNAISVESSRYNNEPRQRLAKELAMENEYSKKLVHHPRFSTPLNNDLKITKPCRLNADRKPNEFTRFLIGIQSAKGLFDSQEGFCPENAANPQVTMKKSADDTTVLNKNESHPTLAFPARNDIKLQKNIVPNNTSEKYGDPLSRLTQNSILDPCLNCPIGENGRSSETRSLIQEAAIGGVTDQSEKISVCTKLKDDINTKKDFSELEQCAPSEKSSTKSKQSATKDDEQTPVIESIGSKNIESPRTKTLTMKNNVVNSYQSIRKSDHKSSSALQSEMVDHPQTLNNKDEYSSSSKKTTNDKNCFTGSLTGSSSKDRTSFGISTVHSEVFEEFVATAENLEGQEKNVSPRNAEFKTISNRGEITQPKASLNNNSESAPTEPSVQSREIDKLHNVSKREIPYLDKSVSTASSEIRDKIQERHNKSVSTESGSIELLAKEKGSVECNSEIKEAVKIMSEVQEKSCLDECGAASTSASTKVSGTSSITGESRLEEIKNSIELADHEVPQLELDKSYIASSCPECQQIFDKCHCKASTHYRSDKFNDALEKSSSISTIKTGMNDSLGNVEDDELCISEQIMNPKKCQSDGETSAQSNQTFCKKNVNTEKLQDSLIVSERYKIQEHHTKLSEAEDQVQTQLKNVSQDLDQWKQRESSEGLGIDLNENINKLTTNFINSCTEMQEFLNFESSVPFHSTPKHLIPSDLSESYCMEIEKLSNISPQNIAKSNSCNFQNIEDNVQREKENMNISKIDYTDKAMNETCQDVATNLEEMDNFTSSIIIDLNSEHPIKNPRCVSEESFSIVPEPIPDEDHANVAADTCSENYSEGELYLPSSCSYSLGEIRISERGSNGTAGSVIQSSGPSVHGMRIYFRNKNSTHHTSDNTIKASNSLMQSPGEMQETDVESISSSQGSRSEGEHQIGQRYMLKLKAIDT